MRNKIALLSFDKLPLLTENDQQLIPLLAAYEITAEAAVWSDESIDWLSYDALVFRNTWDYFERYESFSIWIDKIKNLRIPTYNSLEVLEWNIHKFYLRALQEQGIDIIPSRFINDGGQLNKEDFPSEWTEYIIKPAISAAAYHTEKHDLVSLDKAIAHYSSEFAGKQLLIQKYMPEITSSGEISLVYFNKNFSHAVVKTPKEGDFRIQSQFGGTYIPYDCSPALEKQGVNILSKIPHDLLYARIDGIISEGKFLLMEIELIEPDLYLQYHPNSVQIFAKSIATKINLK